MEMSRVQRTYERLGMMSPDPKISEVWASHELSEVLHILSGASGEHLAELLCAIRTEAETGADIRRLAKRVRDTGGFNSDKAYCIAENVVGYVLARSQYESNLEAGLRFKAWVCPAGEGCPIAGHHDAGTRYRKPIPIKEPFVISGKSIMYPRDYSSGYPEECIDCRCMGIARYSE